MATSKPSRVRREDLSKSMARVRPGATWSCCSRAISPDFWAAARRQISSISSLVRSATERKLLPARDIGIAFCPSLRADANVLGAAERPHEMGGEREGGGDAGEEPRSGRAGDAGEEGVEAARGGGLAH